MELSFVWGWGEASLLLFSSRGPSTRCRPPPLPVVPAPRSGWEAGSSGDVRPSSALTVRLACFSLDPAASLEVSLVPTVSLPLPARCGPRRRSDTAQEQAEPRAAGTGLQSSLDVDLQRLCRNFVGF